MNWAAVWLWVLLYWRKDLKDRDHKIWKAADGAKKGSRIKTERNSIPEQGKAPAPACTRHQKHRLRHNAQEWGGIFCAETKSGTMKGATVTNHKFHDPQNDATLSITSLLHRKERKRRQDKPQDNNIPGVTSTDLLYFPCLYSSFTSEIHLSFIWVVFLPPP